MYSAICNSSPVGLGMLITSQAMATISSSLTSARMREISFGSSFDVDFVTCHSACQPEIIRIAAQFLVSLIGDQEIIFQAEAAAARPINSGFDGQHHIFFMVPPPA